MARVLVLALAAVALAASVVGCGQAESAESGATIATEPEPPALTDLARVVCAADGPPRIETPSVKTRPDGVHVEIVNHTGIHRSFAISFEGGGMGTEAPIGTSTQVLDVAPGALSVSCADPDSQDEPPSATLELIDDDGVWVSPQLGPGCRSVSDAVLDYAVGAEGEQGDPVEVARRFLAERGLRADDVVERAGYPEREEAVVRVVRGGEVVATMLLIGDGNGGWLRSQTSECTDPPAFE